MAPVCHLEFLKVRNIRCWSYVVRSVKLLPRYHNFWIFSMAAATTLYFLRFQICNGPNGQEGRTVSPCPILSKSLKPRLRYGDLSIFQIAVSAVLDFLNHKLLTVRKVELCHCAKFYQNRLNCGGNVSFFDFLRWLPPPSWIFDVTIFDSGTRHECRIASQCQISWRTVNSLPRYCELVVHV